jgi:hypothetical protein
MGSGCTDPHSLDLGTSWRWVISFTPLLLYPRGKSPGTHWIGGCVDPRVGLDAVEKRRFLILPGPELRPLGRPARSQSLSRLIVLLLLISSLLLYYYSSTVDSTIISSRLVPVLYEVPVLWCDSVLCNCNRKYGNHELQPSSIQLLF